MKSWTLALALLLILTVVDIYRSDRRHRDDLAGISVHTIDVHEQISAGMAASAATLERFKECPVCRVGHYYGKIVTDLASTEFPTPPVLEAGAVTEWAYALGLALAEKGRDLRFMALNPPPGYLFTIEGWAFREIFEKGYASAKEKCDREFSGMDQKVCVFGLGRASRAYPLILESVRSAPPEFIAGYLAGANPTTCADGRHPVFCSARR